MQEHISIVFSLPSLYSCGRIGATVLLFLLVIGFFSYKSAAQAPPFPGCDVQTQIPEEECNALRIFFEQTEGESWAIRGGWMRAGQACEWNGVVCETGPWPRNVRKIVLIDNDVGGTIPGELSFLTELEELVVQTTATAGYFNVVEGFLPNALAELENLKILRISGHDIQGPIPSEWVNFESLEVLDLSNNRLDGRIPEGIGRINTLQEIDLSSNRMSGLIPESFTTLTSLRKLDLGSNDFFGPIPAGIGQLSALRILDLRENNFTGAIPSSFGDLDNLISLTLTDNEFTGPPPPSFIKLASELSICSITNQSTQFCVPDTPMYRINGQDNLCGIPLDSSCSFCSNSASSDTDSCSSLESIFYKTEGINWATQSGWLSEPDLCEWYGLSCSDGIVTGLSLPENNLAGDIPEELGQLTTLASIDLSGNSLTGPIPLSVALLQNTSSSCNLTANDANLCIPDDFDRNAIMSDSVCGLPLTLSCSSTGSPGIFTSIEEFNSGGTQELSWRAILRIPDAYFEVEQKGSEGYSVIGIVDSPATLTDPQLFVYQLPELERGIHTFRIHMTSPSAASLYSEEINIITSSDTYLLETPFPNPANNTASVRFVVQQLQFIQINLYDITGRKIQTVYTGNPEIDLVQEVRLQTDKLAGGVYFLQMEGERFRTTQTLIVRK